MEEKGKGQKSKGGRQPPATESFQRQKLAGSWLRSLREARGLSQAELAMQVQARNKVAISQIENGYEKVASSSYIFWAAALGISSRALAMELLRLYDPITHEILFGTDAPSKKADLSTP